MLFTLTERCRLLQIHLSKCISSFQADPACVSANMSAWWLLMDNDLTDNLHFKVLLLHRGYEPNIYLLLKVVFPSFLSPFGFWQQATMERFGLICGQQWIMGEEERLRAGWEGCSITRWGWVTSHAFGSMIREQNIPWTGSSSQQITEQNHISPKHQFWSSVGLRSDRCSSHNHTVTVGWLYFTSISILHISQSEYDDLFPR